MNNKDYDIIGQFQIMGLLYWVAVGFMAAYWTLYYLNLEFSFIQVSFLVALPALAGIISEIPTGVVADVYGRKISMLISYIMTGALWLSILFAGNNFIALIIINILLGVAYTFDTGAIDAWIVDRIRYFKRSKQMEKLIGKIYSLTGLGFAIGCFFGGVIVNFGYDKPLLAAGLTMLTLFFIASFSKEEYFKRKKTNIATSFRQSIATGKKGIEFVLNHRIIFLLTIIIFIFAMAFSLSYYLIQPYVVSRGLEPQYIGYAFSIAGIASILYFRLTHKFSKKFGSKRMLMIFMSGYGLTLFSLGLISIPILIFLFLILQVVFYDLSGILSPTFKTFYNKFVPSKIRATVFSTSNLFWDIAAIIGTLLFGVISQYIGLGTGLMIAGFLAIVAAMLYLFIKKNN